MARIDNYTDWDFENVWSIDEGSSYPYLKTLDKPEEVLINEEIAIDGFGTENDPFIIETKEQLRCLELHPESYFVLASDLTFEVGEKFDGLCEKVPFTGVFDGKDHSISNITISQPTENNIGFFNNLSGGIIKNLNLHNVNIKGRMRVGGIVGSVNSKESSLTSISNCHVTGIVEAQYLPGGIVGGALTNTDINNSSYDGNIIGTKASYVGGIAGEIRKGQIVNSYSAGEILISEQTAGGLVGYLGEGKVEKSYNTAELKTETRNRLDDVFIGGLVGRLGTRGQIINSFNQGDISVSSNLVNPQIGGLVGISVGSSSHTAVMNSYANCNVESKSSSAKVGGLVGDTTSVMLTNSYYNNSLSGYGTSPYSEMGRSSNAMKETATYINWNFNDVWQIDGGAFPTLRSMKKPSMGRLDPPSNITVSEIMPDSVKISWTNMDDVNTYSIYIGNSKYASNQNFIQINDLEPGKKYSYKVAGVREGYDSVFSSEAEFTTTAVTEDGPINLKATQKNNKIYLTWNALSGFNEYQVKVNNQILKVSSTEFVHENPEEQEHVYEVRGLKTSGWTRWSDALRYSYLAEELPSGSGTIEDPYIISKSDDLIYVNEELGAHYALGTDINLNGIEWTAIGTKDAPFTGSFDGRNKTISGMGENSTKPTSLFGYVKKGRIENLIIKNSQTEKSMIVQSLTDNSTIENCMADGTNTINTLWDAGGLVDQMINSDMVSCSSGVHIISTNINGDIGGLVSNAKNSHLKKSWSTAEIAGQVILVD